MKRELQSADALEDDYISENKLKTKKVIIFIKISKKTPNYTTFQFPNKLKLPIYSTLF